MVSEAIPRTAALKAAPDLRSHCPVCGDPYQPGERVLALGCPSFPPGAVPSSAAAREPVGQVILGQHRCVLPRILTLLAGFQPALRFALAPEVCPGGEPVFPEYQHAEPFAAVLSAQLCHVFSGLGQEDLGRTIQPL